MKHFSLKATPLAVAAMGLIAFAFTSCDSSEGKTGA